MERFQKDINIGLTEKQVEQRKKEHLDNYDTTVPTKTIPRIIRDNVFTLFNLLNIVLGIFIITTGTFKNLLFLGVVICNTLISMIQEIRSKRVIDKLSLIASSKATVIRDGKEEKINIHEIVLDDIILYQLGSQVVVDSIILEGECEVNEAFITGEAEAVSKKKGDMILSGSFITSGNCKAYVEHVGNENYTSRISSGAKYIKKTDSEMMKSLKKLIKIISIVIIPLGILLFYHQLTLTNFNYNESMIGTVAALIGMIPEGLILLTSTVIAVSIIRLSKYNVLVQELYCIETLAYVDTICLDKTGTITEGSMELERIIPVSETLEKIEEQLTEYMSAITDKNATAEALRKKYGQGLKEKVIAIEPFSSSRKWSGVTLENKGTFILGAPEKLLTKKEFEQVKEYLEDYRVLVLMHSKNNFQGKILPKALEFTAIILLSDQIRPTAKETLAYFKKQGTDIKLISGDSVETVSSIAKKVGIKGLGIDTSKLKTKEDIKEAVNKYTIFGRVTPDMKKELIVALKKQGHKVAMIGDGVNDVLALKEADSSIAMNSGSDAARNVSQMVLLESNFDAMPKVLEEGRRTINNIERSASLFLVKTIYASILAVFFALFPFEYPFSPIQMSFTSAFTIGIPSFVLALEPNSERVKGNFLKNVLKKAFPTAIAIVIHILLITILSSILKLSPSETSTLCVFSVGFLGFLLIYHVSIPFNTLRKCLFLFIIIGYLIGFTALRKLFSLSPLTFPLIIYMGIIIALGFLVFEFNYYLYLKFLKKD